MTLFHFLEFWKQTTSNYNPISGALDKQFEIRTHRKYYRGSKEEVSIEIQKSIILTFHFILGSSEKFCFSP